MTTGLPKHSVAVKQVQRVAPLVATGLGNIVSTFVIVGPSGSNEIAFEITNFQLTTPEPSTILMQPRQGDNREFGFPDVFAVQVVETPTDSILVHIKRLDDGVGWGQNLRLDILIFDQVNNP